MKNPLLLVGIMVALLCVYVSFCVALIAPPFSFICAFVGGFWLGFFMARAAR